MIKQFEIDAGDVRKVHGSVRETRGTLPADVGVRVVVNSAALTRADAITAINLIEKALASRPWPLE